MSDDKTILNEAALLVLHEMVVGLNDLLLGEMPAPTRAMFAQALADMEHILHQVMPRTDEIEPIALATAVAALGMATANINQAAAVADYINQESE